jgi:aminoglycoside phosphotransferase (APT) family kinase protein
VTQPEFAPRVRDLNVARLADWMDGEALPGKGEPLEARFLSGGTHNVIYELRRGDESCVLRMPPPGAPPDRDKGVLREWRIIEALDGTDVPHTKAVGVCSDASVLGRPFYLMGFVDGWSPMDQHGKWPEPFDSDLSTRAGLSYQLAEGIALLSKVDWQAKGLQDLGRPDGFHERQVDR